MCRCAPALIALRDEVNQKWKGRDKRSDGCCGDAAHAARKSEHNPAKTGVAKGYARAYDIDEDIVADMGDRPLWGTVLPVLLADKRTRYVIYEGKIMYPDGTVKPYTGVNAHKSHLHITIHDRAVFDTSPWFPPLTSKEDIIVSASVSRDDACWTFVLDCYVNLLGRLPSAEDHEHWKKVCVEKGTGFVLSEIVNSQEGKNYLARKNKALPA